MGINRSRLNDEVEYSAKFQAIGKCFSKLDGQSKRAMFVNCLRKA